MRKNKCISVNINNFNDERMVKELEYVKTRIIIRILIEKYGEKIYETYIDTMRSNGEDCT